MYTQCPDCKVAFRITAEVLQQARGRVRCGSCGEAFNALDHLSESPPLHAATPLARDPREEERSRELMETLDRLAGPEDVRIEDTGIEWRVVDEDEQDAPGARSGNGSQAPDEQRKLELDDEPRYDDNTPLPDDFDDGDTGSYQTPTRRATDLQFLAAQEANDSQAELDLSEPGDWMDLLDEVEEPEPDTQPEAAGGRERPAEIVGHEAGSDSPAEGPETATARSVAGDDGGDVDALVPADDAGSAVTYDLGSDAGEADDLDILFDAESDDADEADLDLAIGEEFEEKGGIDLLFGAAADAAADDGDDLDLALGEDSGGSTDLDLAFDASTGDAAAPDIALGGDDGDAADLDLVLADDSDDAAGPAERAGEAESADDLSEHEREADAAVAESEDRAEDDETASSGEFERAIEYAESAPDDDDADRDDLGDAGQDDEGASDEEEDPFLAMTANMQIDPEILQRMKEGDFSSDVAGEDGVPLVETIVMEGDAVRGLLDDELDRPRKAGAGENAATLLDTYISSREPEKTSLARPVMTGLSIAVLALGLAGQYIHAQRDTLATYGLFEKTLGPIYRSLGASVTPRWDVKGWQFETTRGSTAGDDGLLSISSRIANRSAHALPYPLVHISLTDRFEEVIGSRILAPADYLGTAAVDGARVAAGENFTATINIASTSPDATGFKLNVCYRESAGRVRCAIEDFKER
jgi:predicted Zn finger-like uncharacterized protein